MHIGTYDRKIPKNQKQEREPLTKDMQSCAEKIWNAITKYVKFEEDAIFKDPDWPHLWDHKR